MSLAKPEELKDIKLQEKPTTFSGYMPSHLDGTEYTFKTNTQVSSILNNVHPVTFSYKDSMAPIENQGPKPWCVAYSLSAILNCLLNITKKTDNLDYGISESDIYDLRKDKTIDGMYPKTALSSALHDGIYIESLGKPVKIKGYAWVPNIEAMKTALLINGPLLIGLMIRDDKRNNFWEGPINECGHALVITGYDDQTQRFEIRNSWGPLYGEEGYWYIDYETAKDQLLECWTLYF